MRQFIRQISTANSLLTERLAEMIGGQLHGGETLELVGDLGCGKTTFTRGLVRGAGSDDHVSSPTFTLRNEYRAPKFTIYHFDFYRLAEAGIMGNELEEVLEDPESVVIVEWGQAVANVLPAERVTIHLQTCDDQAGSDTSRLINIHYPESLSYLVG